MFSPLAFFFRYRQLYPVGGETHLSRFAASLARFTRAICDVAGYGGWGVGGCPFSGFAVPRLGGWVLMYGRCVCSKSYVSRFNRCRAVSRVGPSW